MPEPDNLICNPVRVSAVLLLAYVALGSAAEAQSAEQVEVAGLGVVAFDNTGLPAAQPAFARGVLALHSFWYAEARKSFREARRLDPNFALAYWGEALTHDHPIWGGHDVREGRRVLEQLASLPAETRGRWSERERMYLDAVRELFGGGTVRERRERFEHAMGALAERFPDDPGAVAFHALLFRRLGEKFRMVGWIAIAILLITGTLNLHFRGMLAPEVLGSAEFWNSRYGRSLARELGAVTAMLMVQAVHDFRVGPAAARLTPGSPEALSTRRRAALLARLSALFGIVVVIAAVRLARGG